MGGGAVGDAGIGDAHFFIAWADAAENLAQRLFVIL